MKLKKDKRATVRFSGSLLEELEKEKLTVQEFFDKCVTEKFQIDIKIRKKRGRK